jgi:hypothetical protein
MSKHALMQARDEHLSRMLGAVAASKPSAPAPGQAAQAPAARAQMAGGLAALATAAASIMRELRQQAAHAAALQVGLSLGSRCYQQQVACKGGCDRTLPEHSPALAATPLRQQAMMAPATQHQHAEAQHQGTKQD